jgi:disulfide bond formation protein DsbB
MILARSRSMFLMAFFASVSIMGAALYLEYEVGLQPCSLCIVQRFFVVVFGLCCLAAAVHFPRTRGLRIYTAIALLSTLLGGLAATRQLWLQDHADTAAVTCHPGLWQMLQHAPLLQALKVLVMGTPDCGSVNWTLLGLSLPEWSLLGFTGLAVFAVIQILHR